jgi:tRNA pseudouridine32 synthase / 23S rRNA pseudouridine746 synthase
MPDPDQQQWDWATLRSTCTLYERGGTLVLDKPAGISVTGERHGTDVVRLAHEVGADLMPAHRIDKVTSGVVLLATSVEAHGPLTRQFNQRTVGKVYLAITRTEGLPPAGVIDLPVSVGRKNRVRIAAKREHILAGPEGRWSVPAHRVLPDVRTYPAVTSYVRLWEGHGHSVLAVRPATGRRHQIRVHLAWIGHPLAGDPLFGPKVTGYERTALHSWRLTFDDGPEAGRVTVEAPPGDDFWSPVAAHLPSGPAPLLAAAGDVPSGG